MRLWLIKNKDEMFHFFYKNQQEIDSRWSDFLRVFLGLLVRGVLRINILFNVTLPEWPFLYTEIVLLKHLFNVDEKRLVCGKKALIIQSWSNSFFMTYWIVLNTLQQVYKFLSLAVDISQKNQLQDCRHQQYIQKRDLG